MVTCFWKVGYDGSQLVLRIFDDAHDYLLAAEVLRESHLLLELNIKINIP